MTTQLSDSGLLFADNTIISSASSLGMRNRIINGAMNIDQRNNGAAVVAAGVITDRFYVSTFAGTLTAQQSTVTGFGKSLKATATTAITALTTTNFVRPCYHIIEAQNCFDLNAKTVTLSFIVETNWTGNLAVSVRNAGNTRSYVTNVAVVSGINTKSVTIPLEATTIATNDNAAGLNIDIGFCNEATYQTATTGSWIAGGFYNSTISTQWCKTAGNFVNITQVQLEQGSVATPFEQRPIGLELALCQRYFEVLRLARIIAGVEVSEGYITWLFKVVKRADPSIVLGAGSACTVQNIGMDGVSAYGISNNYTTMNTGTTATAEYF